MMDPLAPMMAVVALVTAIAIVLRTQIQSRQRRDIVQKQSEVHRHLIDKFESPQELAEYLQSDAGQKFLEVPKMEKAGTIERILSSVKAGILLTALGVAFYLLGPSLPEDGRTSFTVLGGLSLALGIGSLASAVATWALSKRWGLLNGAEA